MMVVKRFYDEKLAQASYLIGSTGSGAAIVIDPNRDVEQYVRAAAAEGLAIHARARRRGYRRFSVRG